MSVLTLSLYGDDMDVIITPSFPLDLRTIAIPFLKYENEYHKQ